MRVVFLTADLALAGAERQVVEVATRLQARGFDVHVVCLFEARAFTEELRAAGVGLCVIGMHRGVPRISDVVRTAAALRAARADVLVSFTFPANLLGRLIGRLGAPTVVTSLRSTRFGSRRREQLLSWTDRLTWANVVNSATVGEELVSRGIVTPGTLRAIPNGIDLEAWDARLGPRAGAREVFTWLAVGRLQDAKDYPTLVAACALLRGDGLAFKVRIVGDGILKEELAARIGQLHLDDVITLEGLRADVPELMAQADAFVLSSAWEGSPNAVMEAMASRLPVVATDVGGVRELLGPAWPASVVAPGNPRALAEAMKVMMAQTPEERAAMGLDLRARVAARHDLRRVADLWEGLLREALS